MVTPTVTPEPATPAIETPAVDPQLASQQFEKHKVKISKLGQRACNEKDAKAKLCGGHLKRWFYGEDTGEQQCGDLTAAWGPSAELYRCDKCRTLYLPCPEQPQSNTVARIGMLSTPLVIAPKEAPPKAE